MAFDLNQAEEQSDRKYGPVPMGSKVLLKLEIIKPTKNAHPKSPFISMSAKGINMIWCEFTVQAGEYEGVQWRENWMLPAGLQTISMDAGQTKACSISYSKMRAIVEANRNVSPKDNSAQASAKRKLSSVMDLNGMVFPATLGLDKGREGTDRQGNARIYFNNVVSTIITPDRREYVELMQGGEIINAEGITKREGTAPTVKQTYVRNDNPFGESPAFEEPPFPSEQAGIDNCPF